MYAIIDFNSRQYKVTKDEELEFDRMEGKIGDSITVDKVLLYSEKDKVLVGTPYIPNYKVIIKILDHSKGDKLRVSRFKAKSRYQRLKGIRPQLTNIKVRSIVVGKQTKSVDRV